MAVTLVSGNNLSVCVGPTIGSRTLSKRMGILIGATGFSLGLFTQGSFMTKSVDILLPNATAQLRVEALLVAIIIFTAASIVRVPLSLNMALVGLLIGLSVAQNMPIDTTYITEVVIMWVIAPIIALCVSFYLIYTFSRHWPNNLWHKILTYKVLLVTLSFSASYVLGANTLGLIVATGGFSMISVIVAIIAVFVGTFYFSAGEIRKITQELFLMRYPNATASLASATLIVELATILNIPFSNTQATTAAVFGTALFYKTKFITLKPFLTIIFVWVITPLLSFTMGLLIG